MAAATEIVMGSNLLMINGYSAAKGIGVGEYVASNEFTVGGHKWALYFYPNGKAPEEHNFHYVSMYVALLSPVAGDDHHHHVQAQFELTLIDQTAKGNHKLHTSFDDDESPRLINGMWGYNKFFGRAMLERSNYLRDDCLKIYCTVGVVVHSARLCATQVPYSAPISTRSCLVKETMSGSNLFVIEGYSMTKGIGEGKYIESDKFRVGGYEWTICFYPEGRNAEDDSTHVSVFIKLASEVRDVQAIFELTLMDQTGKGKHKIATSSLPRTIRTCGSMWGYRCFFKRDTLEKSDYLRNDCLKIYCNVEVIVSAVDPFMIRVPDPDIGLHIGMLLQNTEGFDITFNVCGEKIRAHELILAARSPKLCSELIEGVSTEEVMVPDMEPQVFKALLHFIYTDDLAENGEIASAPPVIAESLTAKLLASADRYELDRLKSLCESRLCKFITMNSVIKIFSLAHRCHAAKLKKVCGRFFSENLTADVAAKLLARHNSSDSKKKNLKRLYVSCLRKNITVDSVIEYLDLADRYDAAELKDDCLKFAAQNLAAVKRLDGFKHLEENNPSLKSELLNSVGGDCSEGGGNPESVPSSQLSDSGDNSSQMVIRQGMEEEGTSAEVELEAFKCLEIGA